MSQELKVGRSGRRRGSEVELGGQSSGESRGTEPEETGPREDGTRGQSSGDRAYRKAGWFRGLAGAGPEDFLE